MLIIYPFTANIIFRGKYDRVEFDDHPSDHNSNIIFRVTDKYQKHDFWAIVLWNFFVVGIPVMVGCHWAYLHTGPFKEIALNINYIKKWGVVQWVIVIFIIIFVLCAISYLLYVYYLIDKIWYYLGYLALTAIYLSINHLCKYKTHKAHIHHW